MNLVAVQLQAGHQVLDFAIGSYLGVSFFARLFKKLPVVSFPCPDNGCQDGYFFSIEVFKDMIQDLHFTVLHHFFSGVIAVGFTDPGIEQSQKIIHLCCGAHGTPRVPGSRLLFNTYNRTQAVNFFYLGPLHFAKELACIGGKSLHIPPLTFGIKRVKRQG